MRGFFEKMPGYDPSARQWLSIGEDLSTRVKNLSVAGDLSGSPLLKTAVNQAKELVERLAKDMPARQPGGAKQLIIVGAGAAGLSAAMAARELNIDYLLLEADSVAATIRNFPAGKKIYDEPAGEKINGALWFEECDKDELVRNWTRQAGELRLNIECGRKVVDIRKDGNDLLVVTSEGGEHRASHVILAVGTQGNPRKLKVPGGDLGKVLSKIEQPEDHRGRKILVLGGGDSAAETALSLADHNETTLATSGAGLTRPKARNIQMLKNKEAEGKLKILLNASVKEVREREVVLDVGGLETTIENDIVCANIGSEPPMELLKKCGIGFQGQWTARRTLGFAIVFPLLAGMYLYKKFGVNAMLGYLGYSSASEISPPLLQYLFNHWYGVIYTALVLGFGIWILSSNRTRHYRLHSYIKWRTISCMFFQTVFLFALPAVPSKYLGNKAMCLITVWPLSQVPANIVHKAVALGDRSPEIVFYAIFTIFLAFVAMPVFVYFNGKRYCSWICGCGALAETVGEPFRQFSPRGSVNRRREWIIYVIMAVAIFVSGVIVLKNTLFSAGTVRVVTFWYGVIVMMFMSGIIGVGLYPFFGARMWCRFLCPLAAYMNLLGAVWSRFKISSNDRCIDCGQCNRYCEMGVDVNGFALRRESFSVRNTPCIGCGECIAVCPMNVLKFGDQQPN